MNSKHVRQALVAAGLAALPVVLFLVLRNIEDTKNDVREAVVRHAIDTNRNPVILYYLEMGRDAGSNIDPPVGLMSRFREEPLIRKVSELARDQGPSGGMTVRGAGRGAIIWIGPIDWVRSSPLSSLKEAYLEARVAGIIDRSHRTDGCSYSYQIVNSGGEWQVTSAFVTGLTTGRCY